MTGIGASGTGHASTMFKVALGPTFTTGIGASGTGGTSEIGGAWA